MNDGNHDGNPVSIWSALAQARAAMTPLVKDAENSFHHYRYTSADTMIGSGSRCLAAHGLSLIVTSAEIVTQENGDKTLRSVLTLTHSDGGVCTIGPCDMPICPDKGRPIAKALCTARTVGLAYCYRDLLGIERPDSDDDIAGRDDTSFAPTKRTREPQTRTKISGPKAQAVSNVLRKPSASPLAKKLKMAMVDRLNMNTAAATAEIIAWGQQFGAKPTDEDMDVAIKMVSDGKHLPMPTAMTATVTDEDINGVIGRPEPAVSVSGNGSAGKHRQIMAVAAERWPDLKQEAATGRISAWCTNEVGLEWSNDMDPRQMNLVYAAISAGECDAF